MSALISGGASGVGRATAHRFASEGAGRITLFDKDASRIADVAAEVAGIGAEARTVVGDVANPPDCQRAVDEAVRGDGRLDVLVSNAGADSIHDFLELELDEWYRIMDINLTASFVLGQAAARAMVAAGNGGTILYTASISGWPPRPATPTTACPRPASSASSRPWPSSWSGTTSP